MSRSTFTVLVLSAFVLVLGGDWAGSEAFAQSNSNRPINRPPSNVPPGPPDPRPPAKPSKPRAGGNAGNTTRSGGVDFSPEVQIQSTDGGAAITPAPAVRSTDFIPLF